MATVKQWIGSNGDVLLPLNQNSDNSAPLYATKNGVLYLAILTGSGTAGQAYGLLLALTRPS